MNSRIAHSDLVTTSLFTTSADLRGGQLWKAERYNHVNLGTNEYTVRVEETYTYAGRDGVASNRDTQVSAALAVGKAVPPSAWRHSRHLTYRSGTAASTKALPRP